MAIKKFNNALTEIILNSIIYIWSHNDPQIFSNLYKIQGTYWNISVKTK